MGSCSFKKTVDNHEIIKVIPEPHYIPTLETERNKVPSVPHVRVSSTKKNVLLEVRKGSIPVTDAPTALIRNLPKSPRELEIIERVFSQHFIFNTLTHEQKEVIISSMKNYFIEADQIIFHEGQSGNNFFIIVSGEVEVLSNNSRINTLSEGGNFGEVALMHDIPRSTTVRTLAPTELWSLDRVTFKKIIEDINAVNYLENKNFLGSVSVFSVLKPSQIENLVGSTRTLNYAAGQVIVKEGESGDLMYIIKDGVVVCTRNKAEVRRFAKGEYFGEQALIHNIARTATCVALTNVKCLSIDRESLNTALGSQLECIIFKNSQMIVFETNEVLKKLSSVQVENILGSMEIKKFQSGSVVFESNTRRNEYLIMVLKGKIQIGKTTIEKFGCIGAEEIINKNKTPYGNKIVCLEETDLSIISRSMFKKAIGGSYNKVTNNNDAFKVLKNVQILSGLSDDKLQQLIEAMKIEKFANKQVIVEQNSEGNSFYIIKSGKVDVIIDGHAVRSITLHDYFGERSVIFNQKRTASVIADGNVECWVLFQEDFIKIIDEPLRNQLMKRIELQDDNLSIKDLAILKTLGRGMFGNVFLVVKKSTKVLYALKTVSRKKIHAYDLYESLVLERKILLQLDHIFIMKLVKTLKDPKRVYFVLEYVKGMDLFDVIRDMPQVTEKDSKFYIACLMTILKYLHDRDIIYRDLKPENVVVDEEGYLKLIDFGTAKIANGRTYTIVGTPHYMAPEVILRKGYGASVDYWGLGIVLYELLFERVPFAEDQDDPMKIYESVLMTKHRFPQLGKGHANVKAFIDQLLNKNSSLRMGGGFDKLKQHPWLSGFEWDKLLLKKIKPPYLPSTEQIDVENLVCDGSKKAFENFIASEETGELPLPSTKAPLGWDQEF